MKPETEKKNRQKMKVHTTNYIDTFIEVADDCPTDIGEIPKPKGNNKTVAEMQLELVLKNPYEYTSDDVLFQVYADRNNLTKSEYKEAREQFFSKGQPCFRASPLTKRCGFGVHSDKNGKIAIFGRETKEYEQFVNDPKIQKVKAMRTSKK
ncbi:MAG: DUF6157 family protein [Saprospiraceae bacterium]|nr:DUF6157 family protein [Saprospiraceae bacterium]